ncbi:hypothetical protein H9P43_006923 [Blastocladiella emersonii ATCC 22665]|nr:hypothetical protein H9P43_006923 [Blastocladiella emersonii ATCC 22665]
MPHVHREAVFRLERVHHDGLHQNLRVYDRTAVEYVKYRTANLAPHNPSRNYTLRDFMRNIEADPYFRPRHRRGWGILKKAGSIADINVFSLASDAPFPSAAFNEPCSRYLRLVLRLVYGEQYPHSGKMFTYHLAAYL